MRKKKYYKSKKYNKKRGIQRIKKVKWPTRNIGGDRAYCKLRYVNGINFGIEETESFNSQNLRMNTGAIDGPLGPGLATINSVFGNTPNLSTLSALYLHYRIRGIKLKLTYWQQTGTPVVLYTNAQSNLDENYAETPNPDFVTPNISVLPEQRWARYRVCTQTQNGGKPTVLKSYYSVNKVQGPDNVVKNDREYIGEMKLGIPYWGDNPTTEAVPRRSPFLQFGLFTLNGDVVGPNEDVNGVLKVEATVYTEFFGKRVSTE